jgi:hypothetical protein
MGLGIAPRGVAGCRTTSVDFKPITQSEPCPISAANFTISRLRRWTDQQTREISSFSQSGFQLHLTPRPGVNVVDHEPQKVPYRRLGGMARFDFNYGLAIEA